MLKRKFYNSLCDWKATKSRECLLVQGARQIGKTYIIEEFAKAEYDSYIYIDFYKHPEQKEIFQGSLEAEDIYRRLSLTVDGVNFVEGSTLIFLDEIQECPEARTALKFLAIDDRYDVIASGSLLGIHYRQMASVPVGYERIMEMHALDFEEFCWAMGKDAQAIDALRFFYDTKSKVPEVVHEQFMKLLRDYLVVGGMPEVVNAFLATSNYQQVYATQMKIQSSYQEDIAHYASTRDRQKIKDCYYSIPRQLAKDYTKFQYKTVSKEGSARRYDGSLNWLIDAGMIKSCVNVSNPQLPLASYEKPEQFKIYISDIGMLTSMYGFETQVALVKNTLIGPAKGGIYENLVFDMLTKRDIKLRYYKNDSSTQEIEFLLSTSDGVVPVEVKSKNGATVSLNTFIETYKPPRAYKLTAGNLGVAETKITLPLYMAIFI